MTATPMLELRLIRDYDPNKTEKTESPVQHLAISVLQKSVSSTSEQRNELESRVSALPSITAIQSALENPTTDDLSESLLALRSQDWSPDDLAQKLMEQDEINENFNDREQLAKILNDLKQLDNHLKEAGCPDLRRFLSSLVPDNEADWVIINKAKHKKSRFSLMKKICFGAYYWGQKISEIKGVIGAATTVIWLLNNPKAKALIKGLICLAGII